MPPAPPTHPDPPAIADARRQLVGLGAQPEVPLPEVFRRVCETAADALGVERAGVWLMVNADKALRCVSLFERSNRRHTKGALLPVGEFPGYLRAVTAGPALPCEDAATDPRTAELRESYLAPHGITALLDAPLLRDGRLVGMVRHEHTGSLRNWTEGETAFARAVADFLVERMRVAEGALTRSGTWAPAAPRSAIAAPAAPPSGGVAHDLRDVLAAILADAVLIAGMPGVPADAVARLVRIEEAVAKAEAIIRERLGPGGEVGR